MVKIKDITRDELFDGVKETPQYKRIRNGTIVEVTLWSILALASIYTHDWLVVLLVAVILMKIGEIFLKEKLMIATQLIVDELFTIVNDANNLAKEAIDLKLKKAKK